MFLIWAIYIKETFPNNISFAKVGSKFCHILKSTQKIAKD